MGFSLHFLWAVLNFVLPRSCLLCGERLGSEKSAIILCRSCDPRFQSLGVIPLHYQTTRPRREYKSDTFESDSLFCRCCGEELPHGSSPSSNKRQIEYCLPCLFQAPPFRTLRSLWYYYGLVERLIKLFKYSRHYSLAYYFGAVLAETLQHNNHPQPLFPLTDWDLLLALPSSSDQIRQRGFSHMTLVTRCLARNLQLPYAPFALRSISPRQAQASLKAKERWANVSLAFCASSKAVYGKSILLIDDVVTTGASISSAALCLQKAGARAVDVLCISRSPHFAKLRLSAQRNHGLHHLHSNEVL